MLEIAIFFYNLNGKFIRIRNKSWLKNVQYLLHIYIVYLIPLIVKQRSFCSTYMRKKNIVLSACSFVSPFVASAEASDIS